MKAGWNVERLGDVCTFENGDRGDNYPGRSAFVPSGIPIINAGHLSDIGIDTSEMNFITRERFELLRSGKVRRGDVLFCLRGSLGKFALNDCYDEGAIASSLIIIRPKSMLDVRFLCAYLDSSLCADMIRKFENGAAQPNLGGKSLEKFLIPLPPLEEQRRIVAVLDEALIAIATATANTQKNLANARELFEATTRSEFETNLTSGSFKSVMVEALAASRKGSMRTGPFGSQLLHSEFADDGVAVLGIDNAVENEFRWGKRRFITEDKFKALSRFLVHPGDVIITIMGTCGRCAIIPDDIPTAINSKHLFCISLDQSRCLPAYLHAYFLHAPDARVYLEERAQGSIMAGLNMGIIREMPVRLPSLEAQGKMVAAIEAAKISADKLTESYQKKLKLLATLKQSLLHRAFTGELAATVLETIAA